jgi:hypothetical protein
MEPEKTDLEAKLRASLSSSRQRGQRGAEKASIACGRRIRPATAEGDPTDLDHESVYPAETAVPLSNGTLPGLESQADQMTLRQKLGEVRRRIGHIQKRGYNERHHYNYVAAADIAGAVGDVLAELGVVVIPRLESITYEPHAPGRIDSVRVARVIMAYTFTDENSGEELTPGSPVRDSTSAIRRPTRR